MLNAHRVNQTKIWSGDWCTDPQVSPAELSVMCSVTRFCTQTSKSAVTTEETVFCTNFNENTKICIYITMVLWLSSSSFKSLKWTARVVYSYSYYLLFSFLYELFSLRLWRSSSVWTSVSVSWFVYLTFPFSADEIVLFRKRSFIFHACPACSMVFPIIFFVYFLLCGFIVKMFHHMTSMLDALTLKCFI